MPLMPYLNIWRRVAKFLVNTAQDFVISPIRNVVIKSSVILSNFGSSYGWDDGNTNVTAPGPSEVDVNFGDGSGAVFVMGSNNDGTTFIVTDGISTYGPNFVAGFAHRLPPGLSQWLGAFSPFGLGSASCFLGPGANVGLFIHSVAIGRNATCTDNNQIMIGTPAEDVVLPGTFSGTITKKMRPDFLAASAVMNIPGDL